MTLDIIVGVVILATAFLGSQNGAMATVWQTLNATAAAFGAKFLALPAARFVLKAVDWTPALAAGVMYLTCFFVLWMVGHFILERAVSGAMEEGSGGALESLVGAIMGAARGALVALAIVSGVMMVTRHVGGNRAGLAFAYDASRTGRYVMTHNLADPEPFPNARVLRAMVGADDKPSANENALAEIRTLPEWQTLAQDTKVTDAIGAGDWRSLKSDPRVLTLVNMHPFLRAARGYTTPDHSVEDENPADRFKELK